MAILKYINSEIASTMVVINGLAITAGSKPIFFAIIGSTHPISFATITVKNRVRQQPLFPQTAFRGQRYGKADNPQATFL